ncbi:MAG: hypothetical protein K2X81_18415 [Candidatus Obscuribacterales bacterium]|nr:hypothetical protein [Candidatus Obscuribacterales bacterium]
MNTLSDLSSLVLYATSVALSLLGGISLLTSKEAFRGLGRVATGIGLGLLGSTLVLYFHLRRAIAQRMRL